MQGAVRMTWADDTTQYIILPINEFRQSTVFAVYDAEQRGSRLLTADDIRANWDNWVGELIPATAIVDTPPPGMEVY